jgi:hypothetical protein
MLDVIYKNNKPIKKNKLCNFKYLNESLNLYSAQIYEEEYIISIPNKDNIIILINNL